MHLGISCASSSAEGPFVRCSEVFAELLRIRDVHQFSVNIAEVFAAFDFSNTGEARICRILGHVANAFWVMWQTHFGSCGKRILGHVANAEG